ncbi:hypothetical protein AMQ84_30815 [Paenibacillus riograndensis]|uniref:Uncharacterized protein n=1 Tax=Paenibacillus riograndensis TaxID=483937 RepID=A0A132TDH4_9BACL|nr:hypothetical protein [Paenibacillus riograndensis]KWX69387.1 hypothetical protein AMQ84_30815 [Paenibacillus riograndensis]KWX86858.1 hypothetical protein AMQ83_16510 [Paenibacillus riograndensis]
MAEIKGKNTFEWANLARMAEIKGKNTFERAAKARRAEIKGENTFDSAAPSNTKAVPGSHPPGTAFVFTGRPFPVGVTAVFAQMYTAQRFLLLPV